MPTISLDLHKSVEENASDYYDKAKKIKKKIEGALEALAKTEKKLKTLKKKEAQHLEKTEIVAEAKSRKKAWYEKFRWFKSSDSFLVIGGRDATTNEIIIKKHVDEGDLVFHTDMAGSPFFVIKAEGKNIPETTIQETANATVTFSRAWQRGLGTTEVFYVNPDQVSKKAQSGEYLTKGAFMIRGKTNYVKNNVDLAVGVTKEGSVMAAPNTAVKKHCEKVITLKQGDEKVSSIAKKINHKFENKADLDEIIRVLPAGSFGLVK